MIAQSKQRAESGGRTLRFDPQLCGLERPRFGQFVRQIAPVSNRELAECLDHQQEHGGRLGEILADRNIISRAQIGDVLSLQAKLIASSMHTEMAPILFPYPAFLSVCMPAFNEELNIHATLDSACAILSYFVQKFEIVVVNDGSRDGTAEVVSAYAKQDDRVRLISHEVN